jgi:hypothetical protein
MPTFRSGAFAQQCYSSHPGSLKFKALTIIPPTRTEPEAGEGSPEEHRVVVTCDACQMRHRLGIKRLTSRLGQQEETETDAMDQLSGCAGEHPADLRVSSMDVTNDLVKLRCGVCHRMYQIVLSAVETYQR